MRNRSLLSRFQNCEWGGCTAYFPPFFDGSRQQSEIAHHIRGHVNNSASVCLWLKGQCRFPFHSRWELRKHMKTAHNIVDSVRSMSPILCCSETHLCEFSWEEHCSGHLKSLEDFICAPSVPGQGGAHFVWATSVFLPPNDTCRLIRSFCCRGISRRNT